MRQIIHFVKIVFTAVFFLLALSAFSACMIMPGEKPHGSPSSQEASLSETPEASETSSSTSKEPSNTYSEPAFVDTFFAEDTFIKYCNASEEPNYESVYKFDANGTVTYSYNMWEGFIQSTEKYFIRRYRNGIYQVYIYKDQKENAKALFTVYNEKDVSADASASFITEKEFFEIYSFHLEWNKQAAEHGDE